MRFPLLVFLAQLGQSVYIYSVPGQPASVFMSLATSGRICRHRLLFTKYGRVSQIFISHRQLIVHVIERERQSGADRAISLNNHERNQVVWPYQAEEIRWKWAEKDKSTDKTTEL